MGVRKKKKEGDARAAYDTKGGVVVGRGTLSAQHVVVRASVTMCLFAPVPDITRMTDYSITSTPAASTSSQVPSTGVINITCPPQPSTNLSLPNYLQPGSSQIQRWPLYVLLLCPIAKLPRQRVETELHQSASSHYNPYPRYSSAVLCSSRHCASFPDSKIHKLRYFRSQLTSPIAAGHRLSVVGAPTDREGVHSLVKRVLVPA